MSGGARVLVIDNDPAVLELVSKALTAEGHVVNAFTDCEEALFLAASLDTNLIIFDVQMTGFEGLSVLKYLKDNPKMGAVPVMIVTGRTDPESVQAVMKLGAAAYLTKPLDTAKLTARVGKILSGMPSSSKQQQGPRAILWR